METLLLAVVFLSVVVLILTPWLKTGIVMAVGSLVSFFYFAGLDSWAPILLLVVGLILISLEVFIPDFGVLGLLGTGSVALGLYYTTGDVGKTITDLSIALAVSAAFIIVLIRKGYSFTNLNRFVLKTQITSEEDVEKREQERKLTVGMSGKALTALRPSGKALFEELKTTYDVLSDDGHISQGTKIVIQEINGSKIVVRKK